MEHTECNLVGELLHGAAESGDDRDGRLGQRTCLSNLQSHGITAAARAP